MLNNAVTKTLKHKNRNNCLLDDLCSSERDTGKSFFQELLVIKFIYQYYPK